MKTFENKGPSMNKDPSTLKWIMSNLPAKRRRLLDFGCGYGTWTQKIAELGQFDKVAIFDIDKDAEAYAKKLINSRLDATIETDFDLIICFAVLELLNPIDQKKTLQNFYKKLKPGGRLLILYNVYAPLNLRWILFFILGFGRAKRYHEGKKFSRSYLSSIAIEKSFQQVGFSVFDWFSPCFYRGFGPCSKKFPVKCLYSTIFYSLQK